MQAWCAANDGGFDLAMAFDVLEHVPVDAQLSFLRAVKKTLKPHKRFICQVPNANSILSSRFRWGDWTHYSSFTENSIDFVLFSAGFDSIKVFETPDPRPSRLFSSAIVWWIARRLFRVFRRLQFASELSLSVARKMPVSPNLIATADRR